MRGVGSAPPYSPPRSAGISARTVLLGRLADYLELTKPRIALLVLITVTVGHLLASAGQWDVSALLHAVLGIGLVAAGSSALNQIVERKTDARMARTANRPVPTGRLSLAEASLFGLAAGGIGTLYLAVAVNALTAALAAAALLLYAAVYTPLKRTTSLCTTVGAIPGALPPVLGWTAAGGNLDHGALALFGILFLWQFPHFLAIGWLHRRDYVQAGLRMLPGSPRRTAPARVTGLLALGYSLALIPVSLLPAQFGLAGRGYSLAAAALGLGFVIAAGRFLREASDRSARSLLWASLIYLPLLLMVLTWDHLRLLQ